MPQPVNFICTKCDFKGSDFGSWGNYLYKTSSDQVAVSLTNAICYSCNSIVPAEILPSEKRAESLKNNPINYFQKLYRDEIKRIKLMADRKSPARCLKCSSHDFELIPSVEPTVEQRKSRLPLRTGLFHRNCGGRIYADFQAPNFFMGDSLPERVFDTEGLLIKVLKNSSS